MSSYDTLQNDIILREKAYDDVVVKTNKYVREGEGGGENTLKHIVVWASKEMMGYFVL